MNVKFSLNDTSKIAKIATIIIFLALIRCISEPFRLQHYSTTNLTFEEIKPVLIGALVASISLLTMTVLSFYRKHKIIIATCILTIIVLFIVKGIYLVS